MNNISVQKLSEYFKNGKSIVLIDVREDYECEIEYEHLEGLHIPMSEITNRINELNPSAETYIICKSGKRSEAVADFLFCNYGFKNIGIVIGGLETYAQEIDNSINIQ